MVWVRWLGFAVASDLSMTTVCDAIQMAVEVNSTVGQRARHSFASLKERIEWDVRNAGCWNAGRIVMAEAGNEWKVTIETERVWWL